MDIKIDFWLIFGLSAQFFFFLRIIIQWLHTEKNKTNTIPNSYWYMSIVASVMMIIYAIHTRDIVYIFGSSLALIIYLRNFYVIIKKRDVEKVLQ